MPARDTYHEAVVHALEADGWRITHAPYRIMAGRRNLFVDLGAQKTIAAERDGKRIAVEIKGFEGRSEVRDLEEALGQYLLYRLFLRNQEPDRSLYLAVPGETLRNIFDEPIGQGVLAEYRLRLLVFDPHKEEVLQWMPKP